MSNKANFIPIRRGRLTFLLSAALVICLLVSFVIVKRVRYDSIISQGYKVSSMVDNIADDFVNSINNSQLRASIEKSYWDQMSVIEGVVNDINIDKLSLAERIRSDNFFYKLREISDAEELYMVDSTGNLVVSIYRQTLGQNLVRRGTFTQEQMSQMIAQASKPEISERDRILVERPDGNLYFFTDKLISNDGNETGIYVLMGCPADEIDHAEDNAMDNYLLMDLGYDNNQLMDFVVFGINDKSMKYATDRIATGVHPLDADLSVLSECDGVWSELEIGGVVHQCYSRIVDQSDEDPMMVVGIAHSEYAEANDSRNYSNIYFLAPVFLLLAILLISYGYEIERKSKKFKFGYGLYLGQVLVCTVLFFVITYFLISLRQVTETVYLAENGLELLSEKTAEIGKKQNEILDYYKSKDLTSTEVVAYSLESTLRRLNNSSDGYQYFKADAQGEYLPVKDALGNDMICYPESELLLQKKSILNADQIWIVNEKGYAIASSSDKWRLVLNDLDNRDELWKVMFREEKLLYKYKYDESGNPVGTVIAYPICLYSYTDSRGHTRYASYYEYLNSQEGRSERDVHKSRGLLLIEIQGEPKALRMLDMYVDETMSAAINDVGCSFIRISDPDKNGNSEKIIRMCDGMNVDLSYIDIPAKMKQDKFNFIREIAKKKFFIHMEDDRANHRHVALVFDNAAIHKSRMVGVMHDSITAMVGFFLLMILVLGTRGVNDYMNVGLRGRVSSEDDSKKVILLRRFLDKKPEEKLMMCLQAVMLAFVSFIIIFFASKNGGNQERFFTDIYSQEFERAVNFYNICAAVAVLVAIIICFSLVKKVIDIICDPLGEKFETYATLVVTIFQFILLFCGLFYGAYLLGMEVKSIGTMATVVAGAVGLGSKEIIADVAAGVQIVTSGKVVLGDRICVDGFTGIVKEIRLRCCMLENSDGMIKSVPNSKMISVVVIERGKKKK